MRLLYINQPMRYDEAFTYSYYASNNIATVLSKICLPNNHVLHTISVFATTRLFGSDPWAIRLPALIAGLLCIPFAYFVGYALYSSLTGLLGASLVAISSPLIEYSTNARGYSMVAFFTLVLVLLSQYLRRKNNLAAWLLFILVCTAGLYVVPVMLYPIGGIFLWLLIEWVFKDVSRKYNKKFFHHLVVAGMLTVMSTGFLYSPGYQCAMDLLGNRAVAPGEASELGGSVRQSLTDTWNHWNRDIPIWFSLILVTGFALHLVFHRQIANHRIPISLIFIAWSALVVFAMRKISPNPRIWLFMLPLYFVWASSGLVYITSKIRTKNERLRQVLFGVLVVAISLSLGWLVVRSQSVLNSKQTGTLTDAESITKFFLPQLKPGDVVVSYLPSDALLKYYFQRYKIPDRHLYNKYVDPNFEHAFIVVNTAHEQSIDLVLSKNNLTGRVDPDTLVLIGSFPSAQIYDVPLSPNDS
jgi:hypothetical protein